MTTTERAIDRRIDKSNILPRDAMNKRGLCRRAVSVRLSACLSRSLVYFVERTKHIFEIFSLSGSHTILVCQDQMLWQILHGDLLTGENRDFRPIA